MNFIKLLSILILVIAFAFVSYACSKDKSPIEPAMTDDQTISQDLPESIGTQYENRKMLAGYDAVIDPETKQFTITPAERDVSYHTPISQFYPNVLSIVDYGFTPSFWADIKITHPFPGSGIIGFDPRVIAIVPANAGNEMNYPVLNVRANNTIVLEPDGYTKLYDYAGGLIPGNANPFKAYFKNQPWRYWLSDGAGSTETQRWNLNIDGFNGPLVFKLVVDVTSHYPQLPTPVIDNAPEPVQIKCEIGEGLTHEGGSTSVTVTLLDWQGVSNIMAKVECPDLFDGAVQLTYSGPGPNPNEYIFTGTISNDNLAPGGDYPLLIAAWDVPTDIHVFQEFNVPVRGNMAFNLVEVTPPWLNITPSEIYFDGDYAYIAAGLNGLHIFDISNPVNPVWITMIDTPGWARDIYVKEDYAFVADSSGLLIINIDPPLSGYIVASVDTPSQANSVDVSDGYAYVACLNSGLQVVDVDPPQNASIVHSVSTPGQSIEACVSDGYAYVANFNSGLQLIDISSPESAFIFNSVDTTDAAEGVCVSDGYAYVAEHWAGIQIVDVDPPENASIVKTIDTPHMANRVCVIDGYAYVADNQSGLQIIDIDPLENAYIVNSVDTPSDARTVYVTGGYAYVTDSGLQIIDIDPPESAYIVDSAKTTGFTQDVYVSDNYAYVTNGSAGLVIVDVDPPNNAYIYNSIDTPGFAKGIYLSDEYAYVADGDSGLQIIDISNP
jgi:hypothetical protein